jgi:hypothetical protein
MNKQIILALVLVLGIGLMATTMTTGLMPSIQEASANDCKEGNNPDNGANVCNGINAETGAKCHVNDNQGNGKINARC